MNYSLQFDKPKPRPLHMTAARRAQAWAIAVGEFIAAHPNREAASVGVLEVAAWKAARK